MSKKGQKENFLETDLAFLSDGAAGISVYADQ